MVFAARDRKALDPAIAAASDASGDRRGRALALTVDVCDRASIDALFAEIAGRFGRLDLLFNNAGLARAASLDGRAFGIAVGQIDIGNAATTMPFIGRG